MRLLFLPIHDHLADCIHSFWYFESLDGLPHLDRRIIVPNGRSKIILTLQNSLEINDDTGKTSHAEGRAWFIGPWDRPVELSSPPGVTRTVGLELLPVGVNHLFRHSLLELRNRVVELADIEPLLGKDEQAIWAEQPAPWRAGKILEGLLLLQMVRSSG